MFDFLRSVTDFEIIQFPVTNVFVSYLDLHHVQVLYLVSKSCLVLGSISNNGIQRYIVSMAASEKLVVGTQWAFGVKMTLYRRRCDVITSHRR